MNDELHATIDRQELRSLQEHLLTTALAHAAKSPFYAARIPRGARLEDLPLTTKADLRAAYPFGFLATDRRRLATYHESSGTSGEPTASYFTDGDWDDVASRFARNAVDLSDADTVLVKTPYAMVTTAHQMHRAARLRGALVVPADNRSTAMPYPRVVRLLRDIPVTVAWCMPTEALLWIAAARLAGLDPSRDFPALRALVVAGEPLSRARKQRIGELFSARVFEDYGSTETGSLAGECARGKLHLWTDRIVAEVHDPVTGRFARKGAGQLVITTLFREGMPLVRYDLEDSVVIDDAPCACGSSLPTIHVQGRTTTRAITAGKPVFAGEIDEAVFLLDRDYDVLFHRSRWSASSLEIEFEIDGGSAREAAERDLEGLLDARLGIRAVARGVPRGTIVSPARLLAEAPFQKPTFLFGPDEDWSAALAY